MTHSARLRSTPFSLRRWWLSMVVLLIVATSCAQAAEEPFQSGLDGDGGDEAAASSPAPEPDAGCDPDRPAASLGPPEELPASSALPAGSLMAEIRERGTLRAGVGVDTLLFGFLNPQTGAIEGFDVEMARLVAAAIFGDPDRITLVPVQSAERIDRINDGTVDLVVKTMTITCERWASVNFSSVYYEAGQRLLVGSDSGITDISEVGPERPICAVAQTTSEANLTAAGLDTFQADTWTECLVAFQQRQAFGVSTDDTILAGLAAQDPYAQVVGDRFSDEPYGIALPKDRPEFTLFVNAVLEQARTDGTWNALYEQWLTEVLGEAPSPPRATYRP